ncbi:MAG: SLBB domain-containing protein, partial [Bacillota bacterium]
MNLVSLIEKAGIVGAGGAGFPTHVKLNAKAEIVIVNGAECEPLLRVDQQLMARRAEELLRALSAVVKHVGAKQGIVALKEHYHDAADALKAELPAYPQLSIFKMGNFYPAGDEQVMVYDVTGRIVPEGGIPLNVGVIVSNVETMLQISEYMDFSRPVTDKYVTVTGEVVGPVTVRVPLGITVRECIALAGGATVNDYVVINGGPMMGKLCSSIEDPVTKTTKALIVLPKDHRLVRALGKDMNAMLREARTACMHCSLCTEVCPRNLIGHSMEPNKLIRIASYGSVCAPDDVLSTAFLCSGCRLCEYACVMDLQPWKLNSLLKDQLTQRGVKNPHKAVPKQAHPYYAYKKFPIGKLITRLGLNKYNVPAPLSEVGGAFRRVELLTKQHIGAPSLPVV